MTTTLTIPADFLFGPSRTGGRRRNPVETEAWSASAMSTSKTASQATQERAQHVTWMQAVAQGDSAAYRQLCERFLGPVNGFAQRMLGDPSEAEEVTQETFLRVWKNASRYTPTAAVSTWIYRIARNLCIDRLRRRHPTSERISQIDAGDRSSQVLDDKERAHQVEQALQALPERQRAAICLVHYDGLSQVEAAKVLEVSVEALESLLSRARRTLRKRLAGLRAQGAST